MLAGRERAFWADAVFFKDPLSGGTLGKRLAPRQIHMLFISALLLGYHDFALELALASWAQGQEGRRIKSLVHEWARLSPARSLQEVEGLARRLRANPNLANIEIGKFIDGRQLQFSCEDVNLPSIV